jgi:hypothetical protein
MNSFPGAPLSEPWLDHLQARRYRLAQPLQMIDGILASSRRTLGPSEIYDLGRLNRESCPAKQFNIQEHGLQMHGLGANCK